MVLWLVRCVTTLLDGLHSDPKQSGAKSSKPSSLHLSRAMAHSACIGTASLSRERLARDLVEVPCFSGKFETNLPGDVGAVQEV